LFFELTEYNKIMKQFRIIILSIATSMLLCACPKDENGHYHIIIVNQSDKTIVWETRMLEIGTSDTLFSCRYAGFTTPPDSTYKFYDRDTWETGLNTKHYLQLILMDRDIYWQYRLESCDTIRKYVPILHRYQLTLEDLKRMNWTVVYPPEDE
jgi:hypothetical protein